MRCAVDRLVGGGQALVRRRVLAELHGGRAQVGRHALQARGSRLEVHPPLRGGRVETTGGSATASRYTQPSRRRVGGLGGRRKACSATAAVVTPRAQPQQS